LLSGGRLVGGGHPKTYDHSETKMGRSRFVFLPIAKASSVVRRAVEDETKEDTLQ
jgi:hypothetical protein